MISDFLALSDKVGQLAELTQALRLENAELRLRLSAMGEENAELSRRMQEAHRRVEQLLEKLPEPGRQEEAA